MRKAKKKPDVVVTAKCLSCGAKKEIRAYEIPKGEQPMCNKCFMPMLAQKATARL